MFDQIPNSFAYLVLLIWPVASFVLFRVLGPRRGLIASLLTAYLLLPGVAAGFELPLMPALNKDTLPAFSALAICILLYRPELQLWPKSQAARALLVLYFIGPFFTILTNSDSIFLGQASLPGLRPQEVVGMLFGHLAMIGPFLLARAFLVTPAHARELLSAILIGTLIYTFPMLMEVVWAPQVNARVYGFFQHTFEQMVRDGGYRPLVFLYHGLWAAFLVMSAILAAITLLKSGGEGQRIMRLSLSALWLALVLVLCKSMASLIYAIVVAPLILILTAQMQVRLALVVALLALAYPIARGADLVPVDSILSTVQQVDAERAYSLQFRMENEKVLLDRAQERALFGWGLWGRNLIHDASGRILSIADGYWIILLGALGWFGYVAQYGLLFLPILLTWWRAGPELSPVMGGIALMLAVNLVDLIVNATITPITWLLVGTMLAWAERPQAADNIQTDNPPPQRRAPAFPVLLGAGSPPGVRTIF